MKSPKGQPTILLADSELESLDKNASLLQEMGFFQNLYAESGSEALAMVRNFKPDLLIISQNMPDISGFSILSLIKQQEGLDETKTMVIVYSESFIERFVVKAGRIGLDSILQAPYEPETFKRKVLKTLYQELDPKIEKAEQLHEKCNELIETGKLDEALQTCNDILELSDNAEVYYNMGYILSVRGNLEEALDNFRKATTINNQHAKAFKQMGIIYKRLGEADLAQECLEHAAELHMVLDQENEAEEILNIVLTLRPNTTNVYNTLGIIYRHQGRLNDAVAAYEKAKKVHPDDENILFNLARVYIDLNKIPQAQECLRQAVGLNQSFGPAKDLLRATELGLRLKT